MEAEDRVDAADAPSALLGRNLTTADVKAMQANGR
jgi:hypothetical protein